MWVSAATALNEEERALVLAHGLTARQIGFRRGLGEGVSRDAGAGVCGGCGDVLPDNGRVLL